MVFRIWIYIAIQLACFIITAGDNLTEDGCFGTEIRMTCHRVPTYFPNTIQEVYLRDINIEADSLNFDSSVWENVTVLDIQSPYGVAFKDGHKPIFQELSNLKKLGIHGGRLNYLAKETFLGLPNMKVLDLSYSRSLKFDEVKKVFLLNTSLTNLTELTLNFINSAPVKIDNAFLSNLGQRPINTLSFQGLTFIQVDHFSLRQLCDSVKTLNLSGVIYFSNLDLDSYADIQCPSLRTLDISRTPTRHWAFTYIKTYKGPKIRKIGLDLRGFPSLKSVYADNLFFDISGFSIVEMDGYYTCTGCRNLENLKNLYLRNNKLKWFNATCDDCGKFKLELIDLSSNGLEYISPKFFRNITTLQEMYLNHNKLYVMEHFKDFEYFFLTLIRLRKITLSQNKLTYIPRNVFERNKNLEIIDLSNNLLTSLDLFLSHLHKLKYLDLRYNRIHVLSKVDYVHFSFLLNDKGARFTLDFSGNTFICDCDRSPFIKWLYVYLVPRVSQSPHLDCLLDGELVPIDNSAVLKSQHLCERNSVIIVSVTLSTIFLAIIAAIVVLGKLFLQRKHRQKKREDYILKFQNDRINKKYLVFLIFCQKEEEIIKNTILPLLSECFEKLLPTEDKLICDGFNEYRLGLTLVSETERCIRQSSVVVYFHSKASCECLRCKREINIACEKDKPIATIVKDVGDDNLLTPLLDSVLRKSTKTFLVEVMNSFVLKPTAMTFCKSLLDFASNE